MRHLLTLLLGAWVLAFSPLAGAGDHLDGVAPLVKDDIEAVARLQASPGRHALLYFGDHAN